MTPREVGDPGQCEHRGRSRVVVRPVSSAKLATAISEEDHAQGPADAAITLVQYGDYECPYTRLSRHCVHQLQREFPDSLRFVFRHFPLEEFTHMHAPRQPLPKRLPSRLTSGQCTSTVLSASGS